MSEILDNHYLSHPSIITRQVAGETILVPVSRRVSSEPALYTLDETGAFLWQRLNTGASGRALVESILASYAADRAQVEQDVRQFLAELIAIEAVTVSAIVHHA